MVAGVEAPAANSLRDIKANIKTTQVAGAGGPPSSAPTTPTTLDTTSKTSISVVVPTNNTSTNNNNNNNSNNKSKKNNQGGGVDGNEVAKTLALKMVQLNDVVPANNNGGGCYCDDGDNNNNDNNNNRGRFLSYASGASTPNTSSDNLSGSWSGGDNGSSDGGGGGGNSKSVDTAGSTTPDNSNKKKKLYKHKHTGSAIDLENMLNEQNCTSLSSKVVHIEVPFGRPIEEVYFGVHNGIILGSGVSGLVRKVAHKKTGVEYAVKCLDLGLIETKEGLEQLRDEIFIMCQLDHPNIVRLEEVYESHSEIYLVQELCVGGELFDRLDEQPDYHYTEAECARLIKQMLSSVRYLHSKGIIHRDLKLENFLFSSSAPDSELKMIDFGLSKHFRYGEELHEAVGTPYTVAPEVIKGKYDERCDIWAIGVIAFLLFSGDPPFGGCGGPEPLRVVRQNILDGEFEFEPADIWDLVSDLGKVFVKDLLVTDPKKRPTAREAQKHGWLKHHASRNIDGNRQDNVLNPNVVKALVNFKEFSDMRKLLSEVLSFTLLPDQIKDLRKEFEIMDSDGTGEISLDNLKQVLLINAGAGSLGALSEDEVVDIFDAMRVNKAETTIHWHEFIAAGLTQCRVDDRNLRLAFDRLDSDHKGYITLNDIINLVGSEDMANEKDMREMWTESMNNVGGTQRHITYDHFLLIMKGQTEKVVLEPQHIDVELRPNHLESVPEHVDDESVLTGITLEKSSLLGEDSSHYLREASDRSLPNMGVATMYDSSFSSLLEDSPLTSPVATSGRSTNVVDIDEKTELSDVGVVPLMSIPVLPKPYDLARKRSMSLESEPTPYCREDSPVEDVSESATSGKSNMLGVDTRRALNLPERHDSFKNVNDDLTSKSALAVNRQLYRAHRQMRISVFEASRRFEEKQAIRARDTLMKEQVKEAMGAGLVMRHGTKLQVTSDAIRKYLDEAMAEQQAFLEKASRRGGRGRRNRKKTISDMSAMMSLGQDEMGEIAALAVSQTPDSKRSTILLSFDGVEGLPDLSIAGKKGSTKSSLVPKPTGMVVQQRKNSGQHITIDTSAMEHDGGPTPNLPDIDLKSVRRPTIPGQFKKTADPFSASGMYGVE